MNHAAFAATITDGVYMGDKKTKRKSNKPPPMESYQSLVWPVGSKVAVLQCWNKNLKESKAAATALLKSVDPAHFPVEIHIRKRKAFSHKKPTHWVAHAKSKEDDLSWSVAFVFDKHGGVPEMFPAPTAV